MSVLHLVLIPMHVALCLVALVATVKFPEPEGRLGSLALAITSAMTLAYVIGRGLP